MELYDDTYGFVNHDADLSPFSLVSQVDQEDALLVSGFGGYIEEYLNNRIFEFLGIPFDRWMKYTYSKQKMLSAQAIRYGKKRDEVKDNGLSDLEKAFIEANKKQP
ncbi:hypothetical protein pEaSNUABM37_00306 [Erwinia phage pEa_SNUABM_37]|nr:hypothetical protein pEaSNUABM37_00306 [Erwinia phage pEa_SNUABM_37]QXO10774.1 hypothetical protein pEaSNUABM48_00306 [Erwinia phage pEa_SNUABM_48]